MKKIISVVVLAILILITGSYFYFHKVNKNKGENPDVDQIRIGYNAESVTNASIIVAYEKGYFEKHGVSPKMVALKGGSEVSLALIANQIDLGTGGITNFMPAMAKGAPLRYVAACASSPSLVFVRPNENMNNFTDFYDKIIAVNSNGINDLIFRTAMSQENINVGKMKFASIESPYVLSALMDKKAVDAVIIAKQDAGMFIEAGAILLSEWETKGYFNKAEPRTTIVANAAFLDQQQPVVEKFLNALIDAHRFMNDNPMEAAELIVKHIEKGSNGAIVHSAEEVVAQWKSGEITNMIWQNPDVTMKLAKKAKEIGAIDKELTLSDVYDLRFENKLSVAQKEIYGQED